MTALCLAALPLYAAFTLAASPPHVVAETLEGRTIEGDWVGLNTDGSVALRQENRQIALSYSDLMTLSWPATSSAPADDTTPPPPKTSAPIPWPLTIHLRDGSRFPARILAGDATRLTLATPLVAPWIVPMKLLAAVRIHAGHAPDAEAAWENALADRPSAEDTLLIATNARIQNLRGIVESLAPQGGTFRWRQRSVPIPLDRAVGVVFAAGASEPHAAPPATCSLHDGSIWCGSLTTGDHLTLRLNLTTGHAVSIPIHDLRQIRFAGDRILYLNDLTPTDYRFEPLSVTRWPWRADRSAANRPLHIAGRQFERGIGMHASATLTFQLDGTYTQLAAVIGIDDAARPRGHVVFRVIVDGSERFNSGPVTGLDPPRPILVHLGPARSLQLVVDLGDNLDVGDHADWANARLIR